MQDNLSDMLKTTTTISTATISTTTELGCKDKTPSDGFHTPVEIQGKCIV